MTSSVAAPKGRTVHDGMAFGGPTASSWREQALTRVAEVEDLTSAFERESPNFEPLATGLRRHLATARAAAEGSPRRRGWTALRALMGGSPLERTASNLDAAEVDLLRIAPASYLHGQLPSLLVDIRKHLAFDDARRQAVEEICAPANKGPLTAIEKGSVLAATRAARSAARREIVQVRSFRNIIYVTAFALSLAAAGIVVMGTLRPDFMPLCFQPDRMIVCPTIVVAGIDPQMPADVVDERMREVAGMWDTLIIAVVGLVAAAMAAAWSLRHLNGTTTPYSLPVALAVLKLPSGALTAVIGILFIRGGFVPGLTALDTPAQIIAWAILFGYAQQLFTRFVDERAHTILNQVSGQPQPREALAKATVINRDTEE
jgi:hypothetical protein